MLSGSKQLGLGVILLVALSLVVAYNWSDLASTTTQSGWFGLEDSLADHQRVKWWLFDVMLMAWLLVTVICLFKRNLWLGIPSLLGSCIWGLLMIAHISAGAGVLF